MNWFSLRSKYVLWYLLMMPFLPAWCQSQIKHAHKTTFSTNDIFHSAVFIENNGLISPGPSGEKILYYTRHDHISAYFTGKGVLYNISAISEDASENDETESPAAEKDRPRRLIKTSAVRMDWVGANPWAEIIAGARAEGYHTYLKKEGSGYTGVKANGYTGITYKNLYPGIDVVYSFPEKGGMEYTLVVQPGADVSQVQMKWTGAESITKDFEGNISIHTANGDIIEHPPVAFSKDGRKVKTVCIITGNSVHFSLPDGDDKTKVLTIDPWVTTLTNLPPENMGFTSQFDFAGSLYVFGAGPVNDADVSDFFCLVKYNSTGGYEWTFGGQVPAANWTTAGSGGLTLNYAGAFNVDKALGMSYIGQGFNFGGTQCIRLTPAGLYDSFITTVDPNYREAWGIMYNCASGGIIEVGGGTSSDQEVGVVNTATGSVNTSNITRIDTAAYQDIICATYDSAGHMYAILNCGLFVLPYYNTIYKLNDSLNGYVWYANSTDSSFTECSNMPFWDSLGGNWSNCLAANGNYLFYYDGFNVAAFSLASGTMVGTPGRISGYTVLMQDGIAVDNCNHLYVGGQGVIKTFSFNGSTFSPGTDIPLGAGYDSLAVHDIRYNPNNNLLYVTGDSFAGTYTATLSVNCNPGRTYTLATGGGANGTPPFAIVTPSDTSAGQLFTYTWIDTAGDVIKETDTTASLTDTLYGVSDGTYVVQVQSNPDCNGFVLSDTVVRGVTGIGQLPGEDFEIYPNPLAEGSWHVLVTGGLIGSNVQLMDNNGRIVYRGIIRAPQTELEVEVARGIYLVKITSPDVSIVKKLIKL